MENLAFPPQGSHSLAGRGAGWRGWITRLLAASGMVLLASGCATVTMVTTTAVATDQLAPPPPGGEPPPPSAPQLRITEGAGGYSVAADRQGRWLVELGDKLVRLWDLSAGQIQQIWRLPIGPGRVGDISAVAISPDGTLVAVGWRSESSAAIYLLDRKSGRVTAVLDGLANVASDLRFTPDGRSIAASLGSGGAQLFDIARRREIGRDLAYGGPALSIDIAPNGQTAVTTSEDGFLRLYALSGGFRLLGKVPAGTDNSKPVKARFSPDGQLVAVGFSRLGGLEIRRGSDLLRLTQVSSLSYLSNFALFTWSPDGRYLYAYGVWDQDDRRIRRWSAGPNSPSIGSPFNSLSSSTDFPITGVGNVHALVAAPDGGAVFTTNSDRIGKLGPDGQITWTAQRPPPRYSGHIVRRGQPTPLFLSADGQRVGFTRGDNQGIANFDIESRRLGDGDETLTPPRPQGDGLAIRIDGPLNDPARLNGSRLVLAPTEIPTSYAIAPDGQRFALSSNFGVKMMSRDGRILWKQGDGAYAVNISANGRWVVTDGRDGVIRWYRAEDGRMALSFYPSSDQHRWVLWTPSGHFDASVGGEDLIGWQVNRGHDQTADFFPASLFHDRFWQPNIVSAALADPSGGLAAAMIVGTPALTVSPTATNTNAIAAQLPPVVTILSPDDGEAVAGSTVTLRYSVRSPSGQPVISVMPLFDGRPEGAKGQRGVRAAGPKEMEDSITVTPPAGTRTVSLIARTAAGPGNPATLHLRPSAAPVDKPRLYALSIGVSRYAISRINLEFSAKDASDFAQVMRSHGGLYRAVEIRELKDGNASRAAILDGLNWLKTAPGPGDIAMLFLSGHGASDGAGAYYYLSHDTDPAHLKQTAVNNTELISAVSAVRGRVVLFLDTCHAGAALDSRADGLINQLSHAENGAVVFASSTGNQLSLESRDWGNGAFTKALVEGLSGQADFKHRGNVSVTGLDYYVSDTVKALTQSRQTPATAKPQTVSDFDIAQ